MVVAGTKDRRADGRIGSQKELTEDQMLGAVLFAHEEFQAVIKAAGELAAEAGKPRWNRTAPAENTALAQRHQGRVRRSHLPGLHHHHQAGPLQPSDELRDQVVAKFSGEEGQPSAGEVKDAFGLIEYRTVRQNIVDGKPRIDGRYPHRARSEHRSRCADKTHWFGAVHPWRNPGPGGCHLGTARDARSCSTPWKARRKTLHAALQLPALLGRRMWSHGRHRSPRKSVTVASVVVALPPCCRATTRFPYTIRVVSEITESNGPSSMVSVCGASWP